MKSYIKGLSGTIENVNDDNTVSGYFTSDYVDVDGHIIFKEDIVAKMQEYLQWGNVRANHQQPVGVLVEYNSDNWNFFKVKIIDDGIWKLTREGVYKGFSLGLKVAEDGLKRIPLSQIPAEKYSHLPEAVVTRLKALGYVQRITNFYIAEISITDRPRNTKSVITHWKSDGDEELPSLTEDIMENENVVVDVGENLEKDEPTIAKNESVSTETVATETNVEKADVIVVEVENGCTTEDEKKETDMEEPCDEPTGNADQGWEDAFNSLSAKIDSALASITLALSDIATRLDGVVTKSETIVTNVSKSDALDAEIQPTSAVETSFKDELISELKSFIKSEFGTNNGERRGSINSGDVIEQPEVLDVKTMDKTEAYGTIAGIIARNMKRG